MLKGYRALDLCAEQGMFCGYVLAHLDCEVIAVEPPGGSPARQALQACGGKPTRAASAA
jgi:crotonobetainyl-CoA:carnitine CoA-transferase CaiB-like acyl-CoA transferase